MEILITKEAILKYLKGLMDEHVEQGLCTDYEEAMDSETRTFEEAADRFYDAGRYEALCEIYRTIEVANETT